VAGTASDRRNLGPGTESLARLQPVPVSDLGDVRSGARGLRHREVATSPQ